MVTDEKDLKITKPLGDKLRVAREKQNLTQAEVADYAEISTNYYARVERGEENVTYIKLHKILTILKLKSLV